MRTDQDVVMENLPVMVRNEAHSAHVSGERVRLVDSSSRFQTVLPSSQIEAVEFVGSGRCILRVFQIHAADPVTLFLEKRHEMVADEATGAGDKDPNSRML